MNFGFGINQGGAFKFKLVLCVRFHFVKKHRAHTLAHSSSFARWCIWACAASVSCAGPTMCSESPTRSAQCDVSSRFTFTPVAPLAAICHLRFAHAPVALLLYAILLRFALTAALAPRATIPNLRFATLAHLAVLRKGCRILPTCWELAP
jgi:hypothetical protein